MPPSTVVGYFGSYPETDLEALWDGSAFHRAPILGASARVHWSDDRLVARHDFRFARHSGLDSLHAMISDPFCVVALMRTPFSAGGHKIGPIIELIPALPPW